MNLGDLATQRKLKRKRFFLKESRQTAGFPHVKRLGPCYLAFVGPFPFTALNRRRTSALSWSVTMKTKPPSKPSPYGRNTKEAARHLGVSESWLAKLRCVGGGPRFAKLGRRVTYQDSDLDAWREQYLTTSTSDAELQRKPAFPAAAA